MRIPIRYFVVNAQSPVMHVFGLCRHTKKRSVPIRLFDTPQELEVYAGRPLRLCNICRQELAQMK